MPFRVHVRDFQSIGDAVIEVDGLTVITGPNNSGKTALIRAIYGAFTNARGTSFVRLGKDSTRVEVTFSDGRSLVWEKGAKVNRYELDGSPLNRVGSGAPAETKTLGITSVEAAGRELWPQFAHQFVGQIFLLNEPGSVLAEAIADVDKVGVLNEALRLSQSDRRSAVSDLKLRLGDVEKGEQALLRFEGLDAVVVRVQGLERRRVEIGGVQRSLQDFRGLRARWSTSQKAVEDLLPVRSLPTVSDELVTRTKKTSTALEWARGVSRRLRQAKSEREACVQAADTIRARALPDPKAVQEAKSRLEATRSLMAKVGTATQTVESLRSRLGNLDKEHAASEQEVKSLFAESGQCPFCGVTHEDSSC